MTDLEPLSARLRAATSEVHERIEHAAEFTRLVVVRLPALALDADPRERSRHERALAEYREVYRRFLLASLAFEAAAEARLERSPALADAERRGYTREPRAATALIRDDLVQVFGPRQDALPPPLPGLPELRTLGELVGLEYVRRGSRAGGAVIAGVVERNLGFTRERGATFLAQQGRETRRILGEFKAWIDGLALAPTEEEHAMATAIATFAAVESLHRQLDAEFADS